MSHVSPFIPKGFILILAAAGLLAQLLLNKWACIQPRASVSNSLLEEYAKALSASQGSNIMQQCSQPIRKTLLACQVGRVTFCWFLTP